LKPLRIGTRGSALALWQANHLRDALSKTCGVDSEIATIKTSGDKQASVPIEQIGVKGVFTKEIEDALIDGRCDLAIHSMKDVPTEFSPECRVDVLFRREDPRDALVSRHCETMDMLAEHARIGTSSVRRASQLRRVRPDLEIIEIRGNVDTRVRKLDAGEYDAIVLAKAGIDRLGMSNRIAEVFGPEQLIPAVGQGALGVEYLAGRAEEFRFLEKLEDRKTVLAVKTERALMQELHGGCMLPLGAWARFECGVLTFDAVVLSANGEELVRGRAERKITKAAEAEELGRSVAREMLAEGADKLLAAADRVAR
jgi:hydroxymethylbilane synthase